MEKEYLVDQRRLREGRGGGGCADTSEQQQQLACSRGGILFRLHPRRRVCATLSFFHTYSRTTSACVSLALLCSSSSALRKRDRTTRAQRRPGFRRRPRRLSGVRPALCALVPVAPSRRGSSPLVKMGVRNRVTRKSSCARRALCAARLEALMKVREIRRDLTRCCCILYYRRTSTLRSSGRRSSLMCFASFSAFACGSTASCRRFTA